MPKFKLRLDLKLELGFVTLYRIERLSNKELGGYVEKESNLDQSGNAWVSGNAQVYGDARVYGNAWVYGNARVYGNAWISGNAQVYGNAWVYGDARVYGNAQVKSITEIINIIIAFKFSITVTPDNIVIGCQLKKRSEWLKVTEEQAEKMGLPKEMYPHYRQLTKAAMKLVPRRKKGEK